MDRRHTLSTGIIALMILCCAHPQAFGLTIIRNFVGGTPPATSHGGGNLVDIFNAAADWWEVAILDAHVLTISYRWDVLTGDTIGNHTLTGEGGVPHRETAATIRFDTEPSNWFLDPTPDEHEEYTTYTEDTADFGAGEINTQRRYSGATGDAVGNLDLLTTAMHEIGHALGLASANDAYQDESWPDNDIDVTAPRPFAGSTIMTTNTAVPATSGTSNAHLAVSTALLDPFLSSGERVIQSDVDILANAQISQFVNINVAVPEPASLVACVLLAVPAVARRRR